VCCQHTMKPYYRQAGHCVGNRQSGPAPNTGQPQCVAVQEGWRWARSSQVNTCASLWCRVATLVVTRFLVLGNDYCEQCSNTWLDGNLLEGECEWPRDVWSDKFATWTSAADRRKKGKHFVIKLELSSTRVKGISAKYYSEVESREPLKRSNHLIVF
jgi:hypothetical protein